MTTAIFGKSVLRIAGALFLLHAVVQCCASTSAATVDRYWAVTPYRVELLLKLDTSTVWREKLRRSLPGFVARRAEATMGPLWKLSSTIASDDVAVSEGPNLLTIPEDRLAESRRSFDKLIALVVKESPLGLTVSTQEYDSLLESWGPVFEETTASGQSVGELAFANVYSAFAPMAKFRVDRKDPTKVTLSFRGESLPLPANTGKQLVEPGDVLRPVLRRVDRTGLPVEDGIQPTPWTYFSVDSPSDEEEASQATTATIVSHTRFPFSARQRGRVEQLAKLLKPSKANTQLRLHARDEPDVSLAGFKVFSRNVGDEESTYLGKTDRDGTVAIPAGKSLVQIAFVQSSGQWIAKIPVVPGEDGLIEAPLVDDRKRLEAEARLIGIREELIDMVARRNILAARVRSKIKAKDIDGAEKLIRQLENMQTATEFEQQRIRQQERMVESSDPRVQQRISKLFDDTRDVLAEFLPPGLVQELKRELAAGRTAQQ